MWGTGFPALYSHENLHPVTHRRGGDLYGATSLNYYRHVSRMIRAGSRPLFALRVAFSKATWTAPVSNDPVTLTFRQHIGATQPLRTGAYSKTLTFTLSTTTP